jgi:hypothetical protein
MRTDADDPARVRDPTIELLLSHMVTLTDERCSRPRARPHSAPNVTPSSASRRQIGHYVRERCSAGTGISALELCCRRDHFML